MNEGQVRLGDFGISRILLTTTDLATTFIGTYLFIISFSFQISFYGKFCSLVQALHII